MQEIQTPQELANTISWGLFACAGVGGLMLLVVVAGIAIVVSNVRRK